MLQVPQHVATRCGGLPNSSCSSEQGRHRLPTMSVADGGWRAISMQVTAALENNVSFCYQDPVSVAARHCNDCFTAHVHAGPAERSTTCIL